MTKNPTKILLFLLCTLCVQISFAQEIRVIDNKGTLKTAINNSVTTSITAPTNPFENDVWINDTAIPHTIKIWDSSKWVDLTHTGTEGSVFFAGTDGKPTENNSELFWDNTTNTLTSTNVSIPGILLDRNGLPGTLDQVLVSKVTGTEWIRNPALDNWLIDGNSPAVGTTGNFLGTKTDVKMQIRSNNWPMLDFGRRGTLNLLDYDGVGVVIPDYDDPDQPLVYLGGDGLTSALQFAAVGASFYQPMFFTTTNGSFRLKGSAGGTDVFEIGSAGDTNNGRLEFVIGDDGVEPIIFKRYDWRDRNNYELFRVQGSEDGANAKTRFGINLNPTGVPKDDTYNANDTGDIANSTFQVNGSVSKSILTTTVNLTLTEEHHTVILGGLHTIGLPAATSCKGRVYVIKNKNTGPTTISAYINNLGATVGIINSSTVLRIQSDGTNWQQISGTGGATGGATVSTDANNAISTGTDGGAYKALRLMDVYDATGGLVLSSNYSKVTLNTERVNVGFATLASNQITIPEDGYYEISYAISIENTTGARSGALTVLNVDGTNVTGSEIYTYHRIVDTQNNNSNASKTTSSRTIILSLNLGNIIYLNSKKNEGDLRNSNDNNLSVVGSGITIKKLN